MVLNNYIFKSPQVWEPMIAQFPVEHSKKPQYRHNSIINLVIFYIPT